MLLVLFLFIVLGFKLTFTFPGVLVLLIILSTFILFIVLVVFMSFLFKLNLCELASVFKVFAGFLFIFVFILPAFDRCKPALVSKF